VFCSPGEFRAVVLRSPVNLYRIHAAEVGRGTVPALSV
jgi:hypothetical protein